MRLKAFRDITGIADLDAYWRRRFFILGGGLAALMLLAWLLSSGGPGPSGSRTAASRAAMAARDSQAALPSAAYGSAWHGMPVKPSLTASPVPSRMPSPMPSPTPSPSAAGAVSCPARDIVLTLFADKASYGQGQKPRFDVYAVSTAPNDCELAFGPATVRVIVTRHGQVVWNSAGCVPGATRKARFERGVPRVLAITWNRKPTGTGGTFNAVAMARGQTSPVRSFKLTR